MEAAELAAMIDQTLLKPTVGFSGAAEWIERNRELGFATLCVSPFLVPLTAQRLAGTTTRVCTVCGFPLGFVNTETKAEEAALLAGLGAVEIDMVVNIAAVLEEEDDFVTDDVAAVVRAVERASGGRAMVKVILETGYLDDSQIARAAHLSAAAGADYVKTSTGFGPRGASVRDVEIMREAVGVGVGVKAAGSIRDLETALAMIAAGATRIGTSSGAEIVDALSQRR